MTRILPLLCVVLAGPALAQRPPIDPLLPHVVPAGFSVRDLDLPYQTDFESFALGSIDAQDGWVAIDPVLFPVVAAPALGTRSVGSSGGNELTNLAVQSFGIGNRGGGTVSWDWYFDSGTNIAAGADQQIIIQPNINTQPTVLLRIARDWNTRHLRVFTAVTPTAGIWVDLGFDIPHDRWVNFRLELAADRTYDLYIDDVYNRSGLAFSDAIEEFVIFNDGYNGNVMYVDNISVTGDASCASDLDGDGQVGLTDLALVLASFNAGPGGDVTGDGQTDLSDLAEVLADFGEPCP